MQVLPVKAKDEKKIAEDSFLEYEGIKMGNVC